MYQLVVLSGLSFNSIPKFIRSSRIVSDNLKSFSFLAWFLSVILDKINCSEISLDFNNKLFKLSIKSFLFSWNKPKIPPYKLKNLSKWIEKYLISELNCLFTVKRLNFLIISNITANAPGVLKSLFI